MDGIPRSRGTEVELPDAIRVTFEVARALEELQVPYLVGGSIASSVHGIPRSTRDADLVADLQPQNVQPLVDALTANFYIDAERIQHAIRRRSSFNLIHHATGLKIDIFLLKGDPLSHQEMNRRRRISPLDDDATIPVASPEDIILQKLHWYRLGNGVSDQQWNDVLGVMKVQRRSIDFSYLREGADRREIGDLLERALQDAGIDPSAGR
jgi:hypothetical protein